VNTAPAHLESKLRFIWDLSVGQIAAIVLGFILAVAWAKFLSPFGGMIGALTGAYLGALLVMPVFIASQTEFDVTRLVFGAMRWRRLEGRYVPGAGGAASGYMMVTAGESHGIETADELDLDLWED
jgi:hypothetical protein